MVQTIAFNINDNVYTRIQTALQKITGKSSVEASLKEIIKRTVKSVELSDLRKEYDAQFDKAEEQLNDVI